MAKNKTSNWMTAWIVFVALFGFYALGQILGFILKINYVFRDFQPTLDHLWIVISLIVYILFSVLIIISFINLNKKKNSLFFKISLIICVWLVIVSVYDIIHRSIEFSNNLLLVLQHSYVSIFYLVLFGLILYIVYKNKNSFINY